LVGGESFGLLDRATVSVGVEGYGSFGVVPGERVEQRAGLLEIPER
jgi:hypothetical protein